MFEAEKQFCINVHMYISRSCKESTVKRIRKTNGQTVR